MEFLVQGKTVNAATGGYISSSECPAVILIHGAGMDRTAWQLQTRNIAHRGIRVFAVDLPGHGRSDGPALENIVDMTDWIIQFMDTVKIKSASLMGHSMGALIALDAGARHSDRVDKVILVGVAETMQVHPILLSAAAANKPLGPELIVFWGLGEAAKIGGHPSPGLWVHGASKVLLGNAALGVLSSDLEACNAYRGIREAAAKIICPAYCVLGDQDKMTPVKSGRILSNSMADGHVVVIENCGHMMMLERPHEFYYALKDVIF
ncbi:MAG: hypothetical protein CBB68_12955 [Rhodospirillaceae bacterium TMED8]|nr:alpha/beta hydrolase [Magnetovibrio sp.]OUT49016.1 MAG: hypothetical protein CBB68_12955 [Rhodospirillaceae bacterium TMED8]|tara:strand:- start:5731 stop:6522 length:792 start_codon:yes stop_codon:yes gene_type:complete